MSTMSVVQVISQTALSEVPVPMRIPHAQSETASPTGPGASPRIMRIFHVAPSNTMSRTYRFYITALIIAANLVQFISTMITIGAGLVLSKELGHDAGPGQANWMAASYSLTQGAFVIMSGRLGAVYGHQCILLAGGGLFALFTLVTGFCTTYESFVAARALTGVGAGLTMPNAVAMVTIMLPPGRARNITVACFAASAPVGGWLGTLLSGVFIDRGHWRWIFYFLAMVSAGVFVALFLSLPREEPVDKGGGIDFIGAFLGVSGLLLFNFAWNQAPSVGWSTPYEIAILVLSVLLLTAFAAWEHSFAKDPIMPLSIFRAPTFAALVLVVLLSYMSFGISLWYLVAWGQLVRGWTVLDLSVKWIPFALGATASVGLAAWLIPRLAAQWIIGLGITSVLLSNLILATMPVYQTYWAQMFPAILLGSVCPDFVYVAAQVIASNSVNRKQQGIAGSLIGTLNLYGNSLGLGFAGTIETELTKSVRADAPADHVGGYRAALYFGFALAVVALILDLAFVRMPKDEREGWEASDAEEEDVAAGSSTAVELSRA